MSIVSTSTHDIKYVAAHFKTWRLAMERARALGHNCPPDTTLDQYLEYIERHETSNT